MEAGRGLAVTGVFALAVVDALLVAWAFRPADVEGQIGLRSVLDGVTARTSATSPADPSAAGPTAAAPRPTPTGDDGTAGAARPTASDSPSSAGAARPLGVVVAGVDADTAWVAVTGTCEEPGAVHVTRDGGRTWTTEAAPGAVVRVRPTSAREAFVTGAGQGCSLAFWSSGDGGAGWQPGDVSRAWSRVPEARRAVHAPTGDVVRPCGGQAAVLDLAPVDAARADVACSDGVVRTTSDSGATWTRSYGIGGLLALGLSADGTGVAAVADDDCGGLRLVPLAADGPSDDGTCVEAEVDDGRVAVSLTASGGWLVAGDTVLRADAPAGPWTPTEASPVG